MASPLCVLYLLHITDSPTNTAPTSQHAINGTLGMQQFTLWSTSIYDDAYHGGWDVKCLDSGG